MIQRKQTLFLLLALILVVLTLCQPFASIDAQGLGSEQLLFNTGYKDGNGQLHLGLWHLFSALVVSFIFGLTAIFTYTRRRLQMRLCTWAAVFSALWYVLVFSSIDLGNIRSYHPRFAFFLPLVAIVLFYLAYRGVKHDDDLVRSADRIR